MYKVYEVLDSTTIAKEIRLFLVSREEQRGDKLELCRSNSLRFITDLYFSLKLDLDYVHISLKQMHIGE